MALEARLGEARAGLGRHAPLPPPDAGGTSLLARVEALEAALDSVLAAQVTTRLFRICNSLSPTEQLDEGGGRALLSRRRLRELVNTPVQCSCCLS